MTIHIVNSYARNYLPIYHTIYVRANGLNHARPQTSPIPRFIILVGLIMSHNQYIITGIIPVASPYHLSNQPDSLTCPIQLRIPRHSSVGQWMRYVLYFTRKDDKHT